MSVAVGLPATKTGFDLIKIARELLSRPDALGESEEENRKLRQQLEEITNIDALGADLEFSREDGFYLRKSERDAGQFIHIARHAGMAISGWYT